MYFEQVVAGFSRYGPKGAVWNCFGFSAKHRFGRFTEPTTTDHAKWLLDKKPDAEGALRVLELARQLGCADEVTQTLCQWANKRLQK